MHYPRKRFGQHFLSDQAYVGQIVQALQPKPTDHLVEIGPGQGALTLPVLKLAKTLDAIELDRDLIPELTARTQQAGKLKIYSADALSFDFTQLKTDARSLRIFGNLPYNISTPLLFHLLTFVEIIEDMLFMLQKEVAERMAAPVASEHYGRLSVMLQYHCHIELLFDVPKDAFFPPPKVTSSIVRIHPYRVLPYKAQDEALFGEVVKHAFGQRRKTLRNSLKGLVSDALWETIDLSPTLRAEAVSVKEFVRLSNAINNQ